MPLFALANTNIRFEPGMTDGLHSCWSKGILFGLFLGKPLGITFFSWLSTKIGISALPVGINWRLVGGVGVIYWITYPNLVEQVIVNKIKGLASKNLSIQVKPKMTFII